jgi:hypothetical protein
MEQTRGAFSRYWTMALESGPILLILHGSALQVIWDLLGEMELSAEYDNTPLEPGGVAVVNLGRNGPQIKVLRGGKASKDE